MSKSGQAFPDESKTPIIINGTVIDKSSLKPISKTSENISQTVPVIPLSPIVPKSHVRSLPQKSVAVKLEDTMVSISPAVPTPIKILKKTDQSHKLEYMQSILSPESKTIPLQPKLKTLETEDEIKPKDKDENNDESSSKIGSGEKDKAAVVLPSLISDEEPIYMEIDISDLPYPDENGSTSLPEVHKTDNPKSESTLPESIPVPRITKKVIKKKIKKIIKTEETMRPDYGKMSEKEQNIYRLNFKNKFDLLRRWYPTMKIPAEIENHQDLDYIHSVYEVCIKFMYAQINSSFYRGILLLSWLGLEFVGTMWLGLDVSGYCQQQMSLLWIYEPLIDELSQVNFNSVTSGWSPFQKIIGLVLLSFALMVVIRMVIGKIGDKVGMNLTGFTSTVTDFFANMFVPKPTDVTKMVSPEISGTVSGLATIPISPPPRSAQNQMDMTTDALKMYSIVTGKSSAGPSGPPVPSSTPVYPTSPSPAAPKPSTDTVPPKTKVRRPAYDS